MEELPASKVHLQPDLLGSFPADVCPDIAGQFGCGHRGKVQTFSGGEGGVRKENRGDPSAKFTL